MSYRQFVSYNCTTIIDTNCHWKILKTTNGFIIRTLIFRLIVAQHVQNLMASHKYTNVHNISNIDSGNSQVGKDDYIQQKVPIVL